MKNHTVKVYPSKQELKREDQFAWKIAAVAADPVDVDDDVDDALLPPEAALKEDRQQAALSSHVPFNGAPESIT